MASTIESASRIIDGISKIIPIGQSLMQSGERAVNRMLENIAGTRYDGESGVGRAQLATLINKKLGLLSHQESPDVNGYTFIVMTPPDLSGLADASAKQSIQDICNNTPFFAIEVTPPNITINTEEVNTQASVSMPYATAKVATGQMSVTYIDNSNMDVNSLHNVWIEYIYGQLWGDFKPSSQYWDEERYPATAGTIDYSAAMYILKYDPSLSEPPVMVGKATGIFPLGLPVKETLGSRSSRELVMQNISYTCSYYEVIHPRAAIQIKSLSGESFRGTILDEAYAAVTHKYGKYDTVDGLIKDATSTYRDIVGAGKILSDPNASPVQKIKAALRAAGSVLSTSSRLSATKKSAGVGQNGGYAGSASRSTKKSQHLTKKATIRAHTVIANSNSAPAFTDKVAILSTGIEQVKLDLITAKNPLLGKTDTQSLMQLNSINDSLKQLENATLIGHSSKTDSEKAPLMKNALTNAISSIDNGNTSLSSLLSASKSETALTKALNKLPLNNIPTVSGTGAGGAQSSSNIFGELIGAASAAASNVSNSLGALISSGAGTPQVKPTSTETTNQSSFFGMSQVSDLLTSSISSSKSTGNTDDQVSILAAAMAKGANILSTMQSNATLIAGAGAASDELTVASKEATPLVSGNLALTSPLEATNISNGFLQGWQGTVNQTLASAPIVPTQTSPPVVIGGTGVSDTGSGLSDLFAKMQKGVSDAYNTISNEISKA